MNLSITVEIADRRILWVGPGLLRELDIETSDIVGRFIVDIADRSSRSTLARLFTGPKWIDRSFDGAPVVLTSRSGPMEFELRSVRYINHQGSRVAFIRLDRSATNGTTPTVGVVQPAKEAISFAGTADKQYICADNHVNGDVATKARHDLVRYAGDELTGLPLRAGLLAHLDAAPFDKWSAVVVVDIDHFGRLNARLGSEAGDQILVEFGARLAACVRGGDFAARLSGDRFGILGNVHDIDEARAIAARVERVIAEPFQIGGSLISIAASIGAAWGRNAGDAHVLFDHAEIALNEAQLNGGRQLRFFEANQAATSWADLAVFAADVREALSSGQIYVAYQPIVELASGRLEKLEALARWNHPVRGAINPAEFIPLAERSGTIAELGEWILDRSCADLAALAAHGIDAEISVNMSVVQLRDPGITTRVASVLARHDIRPNRMWIEVTESVLLDDRALVPLHQLHDLGVHLVIDDFGTGYATFQYLTRLPVDALKIDMTFVSGLGIDASDTAIVRSVINLAKELGLQVVAEGVETESQRAQLVALGCRLAQGWLFNPALPFDELVVAYGSSLGGVAALASPDGSFEELQRLAALRACKILDTAADDAFDSVVRLATQLLATPMGLVSLLDSNRQWFKARIGIEATETSREVAFCHHAIAHPRQPFLVRDVLLDERFVNNPFVTGEPNIRAYAGIPIRSREGLPLGTLCVLDTVPRDFTDEQIAQLTMLADQTGAMLDLRRRAAELTDLLHSGHPSTLAAHGLVSVTQSERDGATAVGEAVVELTRISERLDDTPGQPANVLRFGALELRLSARMVSIDGEDIDVSAKDFDLLAYLSTNAGRVCTRAELLHEVWHSAPDSQNATTVTEHIYRLRSKIEVDPSRPRLLRTVRGVGYLFEPPVGESNGEAPTAESDPRSGEFIHDDTRIVAADAGMLDMMMAAEPADVIGHDVLDVIAPSSHPAAQARMEMQATGQAPGPQVISLRTTTGTEVITMIRSADVDFDELPAVVVSVREIIDPPHLMRQLVNGVINEVSDAVIVTDPDLHVLSWNPAAERLYGWAEREVLGHTLQNVVRSLKPFDLATVRTEIERSGRWTADADQITRHGTIVEVVTTVNVIFDSGGAIVAIVVVNRPQRERGSVLPAVGHPASSWSEVQRAVNRNEFVVYYEPVVSLVDRAVVAVNVRVRWLRPDGGTWDLVDFIGDVESANALGHLARYVYPTAFLQFEQWHRAGRSIELAIDVSANQLADPEFLGVLAPVVVRLRVAGSSLWLKMRESELRVATDLTYDGLQSLTAAGARIAVGGLGSGWASATTLRRFHVDALAFDSSIIDTTRAQVDDLKSAADAVALGAELSIPVWVEGVSDERHHDLALRLGCTAGSGRLYGGPTLGYHLDIGRPERPNADRRDLPGR